MILFVQEIINGVLLGALLALMSVGLSMVFGIMRTANFAYGALYMLGGYVAYWSVALLHFPFLLALLVAFVVMFCIGMVVEAVGFGPFRGNEDATLIFGLGLAMLIRGAAILAWGSQIGKSRAWVMAQSRLARSSFHRTDCMPASPLFSYLS